MINCTEKFKLWKLWFASQEEIKESSLTLTKKYGITAVSFRGTYSEAATNSFKGWLARDSLYLPTPKPTNPILTPESFIEAHFCQIVLAAFNNTPLQVFNNKTREWVNVTNIKRLNINSRYRIAEEVQYYALPTTLWEHLKYDWVAMDSDGVWFNYKNKPVLKDNTIWESDSSFEVMAAINIPLKDVYWKKTRIKRPT